MSDAFKPQPKIDGRELACRDAMVNIALTVVPRRNGQPRTLPADAADFEVCQFAFELPNSKLPMKESAWKRALEEVSQAILARARGAGMVREG